MDVIDLAKKLLELTANPDKTLDDHRRLSAFREEHAPTITRAYLDSLAELMEEARINGLGGSRELALLARAERAERALNLVRMKCEWQPIETAPKDGTEILLARFWPHGMRTVINDWFDTDANKWEEWEEWYASRYAGGGGHYPPTHWMPLPTLDEITLSEPDKWAVQNPEAWEALRTGRAMVTPYPCYAVDWNADRAVFVAGHSHPTTYIYRFDTPFKSEEEEHAPRNKL